MLKNWLFDFVKKIEVIGVRLPEVKKGDDLAKLILTSLNNEGLKLEDKDIIVVTSKIVSKAKGYLEKVEKVTPSLKSRILARLLGKPSQLIELIKNRSESIVAVIKVDDIIRKLLIRKYSKSIKDALKLIEHDKSVILAKTSFGIIASEAGLDQSNVKPGYVSYLPPDPDLEAKEIRRKIEKITGKKVAVVITDTEFSLTKIGSVDIAIGCSGLNPVDEEFASMDIYGRPKFGGVDIIADEIAAAAALIMKQAAQGFPVVIVRGLEYETKNNIGIKDILLPYYVIKRRILKTIFTTVLFKLFRLI